MEQADTLASAYHEAGHAVFAWRHHAWTREHGIAVNGRKAPRPRQSHVQLGNGESVMIKQRNDSQLWRHWTWRARLTVVEDLAGPLAERRYRQISTSSVAPDGGRDYEHAMAVLKEWSEADDRRSIGVGLQFWALENHVQRILRNPRVWAAVTNVAGAVVANGGMLSGGDACRIIEDVDPPRGWPADSPPPSRDPFRQRP